MIKITVNNEIQTMRYESPKDLESELGNCIDVFVEDVETALRGGRHKADVWIVEEVKQ